MNEVKRRILTVGGTLITAAAIALSMLAFVAFNVNAATGTAMPSVSDLLPDGSMPMPGDGTLPNNITSENTDDVLTPDSTTRSPAATTSRPAGTAGPSDSTSAVTDDEGGGILGAVIAVIVVVAIILVVIALIPKKAR